MPSRCLASTLTSVFRQKGKLDADQEFFNTSLSKFVFSSRQILASFKQRIFDSVRVPVPALALADLWAVDQDGKSLRETSGRYHGTLSSYVRCPFNQRSAPMRTVSLREELSTSIVSHISAVLSREANSHQKRKQAE